MVGILVGAFFIAYGLKYIYDFLQHNSDSIALFFASFPVVVLGIIFVASGINEKPVKNKPVLEAQSVQCERVD